MRPTLILARSNKFSQLKQSKMKFFREMRTSISKFRPVSRLANSEGVQLNTWILAIAHQSWLRNRELLERAISVFLG